MIAKPKMHTNTSVVESSESISNKVIYIILLILGTGHYHERRYFE